MRKNNLIFFCLLVILCLDSRFLFGQENSVYTRYGIGELKSTSFAALRGSADIFSAFNSPNDFDINNPASLGFLKLTSFHFGGYSNLSWVKTSSLKSDYSDVSMDYLALGFPVVKGHWGAAIGLSPMSRASYDVVQNYTSPLPSGVTGNSFSGSGGFNKFYFANGLRWKDFSAGINVSYVFGSIRYVNTMEFNDTLNAYNTQKQESRTAGGIFLNGGVQYNLKIDKKYQISFGLNGNLKTNMDASRDILFERFINHNLGDGTIYREIKDTVYNQPDEQGDIILPFQMDGGIMVRREDKFSAGVQFHYGNWSDYRSFGEADSTVNNWKLAAGVEWIPDSKSIESYFSRVHYRMGVYTGTNYIRFSEKDFMIYGVTAGAGFPIRRSASLLNISLDFGKSGNVSNNLISQTYLRMTIGFSISDIWFLKRKYD